MRSTRVTEIFYSWKVTRSRAGQGLRGSNKWGYKEARLNPRTRNHDECRVFRAQADCTLPSRSAVSCGGPYKPAVSSPTFWWRPSTAEFAFLWVAELSPCLSYSNTISFRNGPHREYRSSFAASYCRGSILLSKPLHINGLLISRWLSSNGSTYHIIIIIIIIIINFIIIIKMPVRRWAAFHNEKNTCFEVEAH
jgi:hypothetical protein